MPELMHQHDREERKIFSDIPSEPVITALPRLQFVDRDQKPRPVQINGDPKNLEQSKAIFWHDFSPSPRLNPRTAKAQHFSKKGFRRGILRINLLRPIQQSLCLHSGDSQLNRAFDRLNLTHCMARRR